MTYAIFFGGFVLGTLAGLFLAGLLGAASERDYPQELWQAYRDGWKAGNDYAFPGESCRIDRLGGEG